MAHRNSYRNGNGLWFFFFAPARFINPQKKFASGRIRGTKGGGRKKLLNLSGTFDALFSQRSKTDIQPVGALFI